MRTKSHRNLGDSYTAVGRRPAVAAGSTDPAAPARRRTSAEAVAADSMGPAAAASACTCTAVAAAEAAGSTGLVGLKFALEFFRFRGP